MKINRLMQMIFVSGSLCAALPALSGSGAQHRGVTPHRSSSQHVGAECGDDPDDGDGDGDGDGDDGDDGDGDDGTETIEL